MKSHRSVLTIVLLLAVTITLPCFGKEGKTVSQPAPQSVRFWVSPDGDVFVEETRGEGGLFAKRKQTTSGVLLRLHWPPTVVFSGLPEEPILSAPHGSVHFIGGERLLAVTAQTAGEDDFRVLFWDGIEGVWRLLAPMATLDPVRGVFRTTQGPKRWFAVSAPDDGIRVTAFLLDDYLSDVKRKLFVQTWEPRMPKCLLQGEDGSFVGIVMVPMKPTLSQRSRMTEGQKERSQALVEIAVFDVSGTEATVEPQRHSLDLGQITSHIATVGDCCVCGFLSDDQLRVLGFKLASEKVEKVATQFKVDRLAKDSLVDLSPSIHNDGFILIDADAEKVVVRKLSPALAKVGEWTLNVPKEAESPLVQLVFNEKTGFLHLSDSKGKIIVCTVAGSSQTLWPPASKEERQGTGLKH